MWAHKTGQDFETLATVASTCSRLLQAYQQFFVLDVLCEDHQDTDVALHMPQ